jgi:hypothetical protein
MKHVTESATMQYLQHFALCCCICLSAAVETDQIRIKKQLSIDAAPMHACIAHAQPCAAGAAACSSSASTQQARVILAFGSEN